MQMILSSLLCISTLKLKTVKSSIVLSLNRRQALSLLRINITLTLMKIDNPWDS